MKAFPLISLCAILFTIDIPAATIKVPDRNESVQSAIEKAGSGDTVFVRIGIYRESIVLKDDVTLMGESMTGTRIRGDRGLPVITAANNSTIRNLTLERGRIGLLCENVDCVLEQVIVRNNRETGIHCLVTLPAIYNCIVHRNRWSGIFCESARSIKTSIMHNVIAENGYCGIMLEGQSEVLIQNNVILGNGQFGIWGVEESRRSRIVYNNFFGNRNSVNVYLKKDASNTTEDPGYPRVRGGFDFFSTSSVMLKGKGKDGATIGLIGGEVLTQKFADPDEDGVRLDEDRCPSIPEDIDGFEDSDGCPEFDNDNDGIYDAEDACPSSPEDYDGFRDEDGCDDWDNDKDGIPDSVDVCKNNPETVNGFKDEDGCPDEIPHGEDSVRPGDPNPAVIPDPVPSGQAPSGPSDRKPDSVAE